MHTWLKLAIGMMSIVMGFACGLFAILRDDPEHDLQHPLSYSGPLDDDVQYFAPGEEFKLPWEAAELKRYAAEQQVHR